jgi:hypothetical protein
MQHFNRHSLYCRALHALPALPELIIVYTWQSQLVHVASAARQYFKSTTEHVSPSERTTACVVKCVRKLQGAFIFKPTLP